MQSFIAFISKVWVFLQGKRTYIIAACIFLLGGAKAVGWVDTNTYEALFAFLGGGAIASLRASKNTPSDK